MSLSSSDGGPDSLDGLRDSWPQASEPTTSMDDSDARVENFIVGTVPVFVGHRRSKSCSVGGRIQVSARYAQRCRGFTYRTQTGMPFGILSVIARLQQLPSRFMVAPLLCCCTDENFSLGMGNHRGRGGYSALPV